MDEMRTGEARQSPSIARYAGRVQALHHGHIVADSGEAILVRAEGHPDTFYFPIQDVEMSQMRETGVTERSPLGVAHFWTFSRDGKIHENAVWEYREPAAGAEDLQGMVAFQPDIIEIHFVEPEGGERMWNEEARRMGEYIRHTDSGSGRSQEAPWPPNAGLPRD